MEFIQKDLLTEKEIMVLIQSDLPGVRAELLASKLKKYCFIRDEGDNVKAPVYYRIQTNLVYKSYTTDINNKIKLIQQSYIEKSYQALSAKVQSKISTDITSGNRTKLKIYKNTTFAEYEVQLINLLTIDSSDPRMKSIDRTPLQIHYLNGYYDLKAGTLKDRKFGVHYVTKVINRDYKGSTESQQTKVINSLKKVYPIEEDLNTILIVMGAALSGLINAEQLTLFLIGLGSSGKSFVMELLVKVLECYIIELSSETFLLSNPCRNKIINSFLFNPQFLFAWINEMKDGKMDEALFKDFIDGKAKTTSLYADGQNTIHILALIIATMNTIPNFIADSGMTRRVNVYEHKSHFSKDVEKDDYENHVYKANKFAIKEMVEAKLLDAFFDILAGYCKRWVDGEKIKFSQRFADATQLVVGSNDQFQDFIDKHLILTGQSTDTISKDSMRKVFLEMFPDKHLNDKQVISSLKQKKLEYNPYLRMGGVRGAFTGVQFRDDDDERIDDEDDIACERGVDTSRIPVTLSSLSPADQYKYHQDQLNAHHKHMQRLTQLMFREPVATKKIVAKKGFGAIAKPKPKAVPVESDSESEESESESESDDDSDSDYTIDKKIVKCNSNNIGSCLLDMI